jgi:HSP20 family molecular chaperone IbpA
VSEPQTEQATSAERRQVKKQRALNALVFLLATAFCMQAYVLWETNERLNATVAELESVKQDAENMEWKTIPKQDDSGRALNAPTAQQPQAERPQLPDPFAQIDLRTWNSLSSQDRLRAQINWLMEQMRSHQSVAPQPGEPSRTVGSTLQTGINRRGDAYIVKAILPGVDSSNVTIRVEKQSLVVCVKQERKTENLQPDGTAQKRMSGQCTQHVTFPEPVDGAAMKWTLLDDVLTITIPKAGRANSGSDSDPSRSVRD